MTCPNNIKENRLGSYLFVDTEGTLIVLQYLTRWAGEELYGAVEVNTFDFPPAPMNCNDEFYLNHKVKPGYATE